jgi:uncharacterized membrane protein YeaQ/YmgE (transglycosylase-associated protein family)
MRITVEGTMGFLSWVVLGLVAGALAKLILPGDDPGGIVVTGLIGAAGGVVGGFIGNALGWGSVDGLDLGSIVLAVIGAIVLLIAYRVLRRRGAG